MANNNQNNNPWSGIIGLLMILGFVVGLFMLARFVFRLLFFLSPVFFVAALVIDYRVFTNHINWIAGLFKRELALGLLVSFLSIVGFPVLALYLLGRALMNRESKKALSAYEKQRDGELIDYEVVDDFDHPAIKNKMPREEDFLGNQK
jgi:hypothetical protein